jgi:uncharacterized protein (UPF0333 family)
MKTIIAVAVLVAVIAGGYFLKDYFSQSSALETLNSQIIDRNTSLKIISNSTTSVEEEINKIKTNRLRSSRRFRPSLPLFRIK